MGKTVWIMNHYASHMLFDKGGRHYNFAKYLCLEGYRPVVFCANIQNASTDKQYFETDNLWVEKVSKDINVPFVYVKARTYTGNGKQRVMNMVDFYRNVKKTAMEYAEKYDKPDVIIASSVHPLTLIAGIQIAKKFHIKCICEIRDLWPESIVEYSQRWNKSNPIIKALYQGEKLIYKKADAIIFTMEGGYQYIVDKKWDKVIHREKVYVINNGIDFSAFKNNEKKYVHAIQDNENKDHFVVTYTGSIRKVNDVSFLIDVAKKITNPNVIMRIFGSGNEEDELKKRVKDEEIDNVLFMGRVEKSYIPSVLAQSDILVFHMIPSSLQRYGLSLNKMFEYLAAGKPIVMDADTEYNPVTAYHAGIQVPEMSADAFAKAIDDIANVDKDNYEKYCKNAIEAARHYDFAELTSKLIQVIENL